MKKFEVFKGPTTYMSTTSLVAVPFDSLPSMQRAGYKFRLDGKVVSMSRVLELKSAAAEEKRNMLSGAVTDESGDPLEGIAESTNSAAVVMGEADIVDETIKDDPKDRPDPSEVNPIHFDPVPVPAYKPVPVPKPIAPPVAPKKGRATKKVYCKETDTVYDSMSAAGRALGLDPAAVSYAAANDRSTKGYTFSVVE